MILASIPWRIFALLISWGVILIGPHFLENRDYFYLLCGVILFLFNMWLLYPLFSRIELPVKNLQTIYVAYISLVSLIIILALYKFNLPYLLFSRFGSYTMFLDDTNVFFGDLIHLTSASACENPAIIGTVVCDPWGRVFNQNPQVVYVLKFLSIENSDFLGLALLFFAFTSIYALSQTLLPKSPFIWLLLISPPMILAIDRGNEILTLGLINFYIYFKSKGAHPLVCFTPLLFAGFFKFWPFIIVIFLSVFAKELTKIQRFVVALIPLLYILLNAKNLLLISKFTQVGDVSGGSFGFALLDFSSPYAYLITLLAILFVLLYGYSKNHLFFDLQSSDKFYGTTLSLMSTYVVLFFSGSHFTYRLILLIPLAMLLMRNTDSLGLVMFIFVTLFMSRFSVVAVSTFSLTIIFMWFIYKSFRINSNKIFS